MKRFLIPFLILLFAGALLATSCVFTDKPTETVRTEATEDAGPDGPLGTFLESGEQNGYRYEKYSRGIKLLRYTGNESSVILPEEIDGLPVTVLGEKLFTAAFGVEHVTVPKTVAQIEGGAFSGCRDLLSVEPDPASPYFLSDGGILFSADRTVLMLHAQKAPATVYEIPEGTTEIAPYAFAGSVYLETLTIPDSVKTLGEGAFSGSTALSSLILPASVTAVPDKLCHGCTGLAELVFPDTLQKIGDLAFNLCISVPSLSLPDGLISIGDSAFANCTSLRSVVLPDSVTSIGNAAFTFCRQLREVRLSAGLTVLPDEAFSFCEELNTVTGDDNLEKIGNNVFYYSKLLNYSVPDGVRSLGSQVFGECHNMLSVSIPPSVTEIGDELLFDCDWIEIRCRQNSAAEKYAVEHGLVYSYNYIEFD